MKYGSVYKCPRVGNPRGVGGWQLALQVHKSSGFRQGTLPTSSNSGSLQTPFSHFPHDQPCWLLQSAFLWLSLCCRVCLRHGGMKSAQTTWAPNARISARLELDNGADADGTGGAPRALPVAFRVPVVCSKSHLLLSPRPVFHTLRVDFSLWSVRPLCGFPYCILFCGCRANPFLPVLPGMCGVYLSVLYTRGFYFTSLEWNGSHPAGLGAHINRRTRKAAFHIQNINQPPLRATRSCFDERLLTAPQTVPWGPTNHLIPTALSQASTGQISLPGAISFQPPAALSFFGFSCFSCPLLVTHSQRGQGEHGRLKCTANPPIFFFPGRKLRPICLWSPLTLELMSKGPIESLAFPYILPNFLQRTTGECPVLDSTGLSMNSCHSDSIQYGPKLPFPFYNHYVLTLASVWVLSAFHFPRPLISLCHCCNGPLPWNSPPSRCLLKAFLSSKAEFHSETSMTTPTGVFLSRACVVSTLYSMSHYITYDRFFVVL